MSGSIKIDYSEDIPNRKGIEATLTFSRALAYDIARIYHVSINGGNTIPISPGKAFSRKVPPGIYNIKAQAYGILNIQNSEILKIEAFAGELYYINVTTKDPFIPSLKLISTHYLAPKIFISYHRNDSKGIAASIQKTLVENFGVQNIFRDADNLKSGDLFIKKIFSSLGSSSYMILIIGKSWQQKVADPTDFVRKEIEFAIEKGIIILPIIFDDELPLLRKLPSSISMLANLQIRKINDGVHYQEDMNTLILEMLDR